MLPALTKVAPRHRKKSLRTGRATNCFQDFEPSPIVSVGVKGKADFCSTRECIYAYMTAVLQKSNAAFRVHRNNGGSGWI